MFLGAGNVHAYLRGVGVEIMANSDNVLRCALTPKHVDVEELLAITDFTELPDPRWPSDGLGLDDDFEVPVPDFGLHTVDLDGYRKPDQDSGSCAVGLPGPCIVLALGECTVTAYASDGTGAQVRLPVPRGGAAFVAARPDGRPFGLDGNGAVVIATVGTVGAGVAV